VPAELVRVAELLRVFVNVELRVVELAHLPSPFALRTARGLAPQWWL
jgi:hypothetical protein